MEVSQEAHVPATDLRRRWGGWVSRQVRIDSSSTADAVVSLFLVLQHVIDCEH